MEWTVNNPFLKIGKCILFSNSVDVFTQFVTRFFITCFGNYAQKSLKL